MVKHGEMTPFGTLIDFDKGCSINKAKKPIKLDSKSNGNDFDSFLLDLDKQLIDSAKKANKKPLIKHSVQTSSNLNITSHNLSKNDKVLTKKALSTSKVDDMKKSSGKNMLSSSYLDSNLTEFDKFLSDFDKPKTSKQAEKPATNSNTQASSKSIKEPSKLLNVKTSSNENLKFKASNSLTSKSEI